MRINPFAICAAWITRFTAFAVAGLLTIGPIGTALADGPAQNWQLGLSDAVTPGQAQLNSFHNLLLVIITGITIFVLALLLYVMFRFNAKRNPVPSKTTHNALIEVVWTVVPVLILLVIAFPSFRLLYFLDKTEEPELSLVVRGYQWYWGYELPDQQIPEYSSYMVEDADLTEDQIRLLSTTAPVVLPVDTNIQVLITAGDVLHSWAMPNFGVKTDAVPGQMNETWFRIEQEGVYYGQCSEICGTGHGFMPIEVHAVSREAFDDWVVEQTAGLDLETPPVLLTRAYPGTETAEVQ
ncbi:MAG: cytochrome c oxidase subunit II [Pseudomonadota bacterium]